VQEGLVVVTGVSNLGSTPQISLAELAGSLWLLPDSPICYRLALLGHAFRTSGPRLSASKVCCDGRVLHLQQASFQYGDIFGILPQDSLACVGNNWSWPHSAAGEFADLRCPFGILR